MAILGVLILAFGWFGFNAGSTLSGGDLRIAVVAVNTMLGSAAGAVSAMIAINYLRGKPDLSFMANGMLAGLVAVTGPCAYINSTGAVLIGLIAGILLVGATIFVESRLKIDDPVGAISVHGVNGAWGVIAIGLFADGTYGAGLNGVSGGVRGIFYGGGMGQLTAEIIGVVACIAFTFTAFHVFFKMVGYVIGNRVSTVVELEGLDIGEIGVQAYPEFLPVVPAVPTAQPEIIPVAASTSVPILGEGLAVAKANAG
jgi:Amt family ammonium transporter